MGLFDTVKLKANSLATDAERAGKVTAAQARTVVLQNEIRKAERELGHATFSLIENNEIGHPDLDAAATRLREARLALKEKEDEIAELRHGAAAHDPAAAAATAAAPAEDVAAPAAEAAPDATEPAATPAGEEPPAS